MKWALVDGRRSQAQPGLMAVCPGCGGEVHSKCGELVQWHWAHRSNECDPWSEPESAWHLDWKNRFPAEWQERVIGDHRADVLTPRGVIEFQKSAISTSMIREREQFYGRMIWIVDASGFNLERSFRVYWKRFKETHGTLSILSENWEQYFNDRNNYADKMFKIEPHFRWLWPRKSWLAAKKAIFLDRGDDDLLQVKWVGRSGGYLICKRMLKEQFVAAACKVTPG